MVTLFYWKFTFCCNITYILATYNFSPKHLHFLPLVISSSHLWWFVEQQCFPPAAIFPFQCFLLNTQLLPLNSKFGSTSFLFNLFVFSCYKSSYAIYFFYLWYLSYFTIYPTFTTICSIFIVLPYLLLSMNFSFLPPSYPGNTPWSVKHIIFSCNLRFAPNIDPFSLDFVLVLHLTLFFWKCISSSHLKNNPSTYHVSLKHLLFHPRVILTCYLLLRTPRFLVYPPDIFSFSLIFFFNAKLLLPNNKFGCTPFVFNLNHIFLLLFVIRYIFIDSWHSHYFTVHPN